MPKKSKYKEIFKLKKMLEDAGIPFIFKDRSLKYNETLGLPELVDRFGAEWFEQYQICYPHDRADDGQWISVIEGTYTYGSDVDRLEIMGGFTPYERFKNQHKADVLGYLTARNVFNRIKNHYEREVKIK